MLSSEGKSGSSGLFEVQGSQSRFAHWRSVANRTLLFGLRADTALPDRARAIRRPVISVFTFAPFIFRRCASEGECRSVFLAINKSAHSTPQEEACRDAIKH